MDRARRSSMRWLWQRRTRTGGRASCHLRMAGGLPPTEIPHVAGKTGNFPTDPGPAGLEYFFCLGARQELFSEIGCSIRKIRPVRLAFLPRGRHCHMHVHPVILNAIVESCRITVIKRTSGSGRQYFSGPSLFASPVISPRDMLYFQAFNQSMKRILGKRGFIFPQQGIRKPVDRENESRLCH